MKNVNLKSGVLALLLATHLFSNTYGRKASPDVESKKPNIANGVNRAGMVDFAFDEDMVKKLGARLDSMMARQSISNIFYRVLPHKDNAVDTIKTATDTTNVVSLRADTLVTPHAVNACAVGKDVLYTRADSSQYRLTGGTRAWRNNNPGCIRFGKIARDAGAIGTAGGFAVFPSEEHGRNALANLLRTDDYSKLTIGRAIMRYAPPYQNNTAAYKRRLQELTGLSLARRMGDLSEAELSKCIDAICTIEGWREGRQIDLPRVDANMMAMANVRGHNR